MSTYSTHFSLIQGYIDNDECAAVALTVAILTITVLFYDNNDDEAVDDHDDDKTTMMELVVARSMVKGERCLMMRRRPCRGRDLRWCRMP